MDLKIKPIDIDIQKQWKSSDKTLLPSEMPEANHMPNRLLILT